MSPFRIRLLSALSAIHLGCSAAQLIRAFGVSFFGIEQATACLSPTPQPARIQRENFTEHGQSATHKQKAASNR